MVNAVSGHATEPVSEEENETGLGTFGGWNEETGYFQNAEAISPYTKQSGSHARTYYGQ